MEEYGLELTNNSKAGWAFSLPRSATCIGATEICRKVCYGNGVRYQTAGQKEKRLRNLRTVELLLSHGGPQLLADNLVDLVDKAKPADWLAASIAFAATQTPWTLRLHDVGDFHSAEYAHAWAMTVLRRPKCAFWFYTRSFVDRDTFVAMTELASLPNCRGWLSVDSENFKSALVAYAMRPDIWQLALLQEEQEHLPSDSLPALREVAAPKHVVSFPVHRGRYHAAPIADKTIFSCPAVLGLHKLEPSSQKPRPCQSCSYCLPATSTPCSVEV